MDKNGNGDIDFEEFKAFVEWGWNRLPDENTCRLELLLSGVFELANPSNSTESSTGSLKMYSSLLLNLSSNFYSSNTSQATYWGIYYDFNTLISFFSAIWSFYNYLVVTFFLSE